MLQLLLKTQHLQGLVMAIGWIESILVLAQRLRGREKTPMVRLRRLSTAPFVELHPCDSDLFVASQTVGWLEYGFGHELQSSLAELMDRMASEGKTPVIIDGGANVGYSSLFFADTFPGATVIACEPDRETFEILERNVARHPRIRPVNAAIWNHSDGISLGDGDSGSWSVAVQSNAESAPTTASLTLDQVESLVDAGSTAILKLDIEGAERQACEGGHSVVSRTPCIIVEPHDFLYPGSSTLVGLFKGLEGRLVDTLVSGENLLFVDSALRAPIDATQ